MGMMKFNADTYQLETGSLGRIALIVGIVGLLLCVAGLFMDSHQFFQAYLTAFTFWTTLSLGGIFFVLVHFLTGAVWSVVLRRIAENLASLIPVLTIFALPLFFGLHDLFHWSDAEYVAKDELLSHKVGFLNVPFFIVRNVIYFAVWNGIIFLINRFEKQLDAGDMSAVGRLRKIAAIGVVLYAFTVTFFGFDWLMSLDAHWYSTMFGVYVFSGGFLTSLAVLTLILIFFHRQGVAEGLITMEHLHDMGKMMFAFTVWWAYIGGSQYFLIWYGNIPEETLWFLHRWEHGWKPVSMALIFLHFALPFALLIFQASKRNLIVLASVAGLLTIMHYVDHFWMVMPSFENHGPHLGWMHLAAWLGIGGIYVWFLCRRMGRGPLLPGNDPKFKASVRFAN